MPHVYIVRNNIGTYADHQFLVGGDSGNTSGFDPIRRRFWRFGADDTDNDLIQWIDIDTWYTGRSHVSMPTVAGGCIWHPYLKKFYIYGGRLGGGPGSLSTTRIYSFEPITQTLTLLSEELPEIRNSCSAGVDPNTGLVYIFGGSLPWTDKIAVHNPFAGTCANVTAVLPVATANVGVVWAPNVSKFFLIGGSLSTSSDTDAILTYNPATPNTNPVDTGVNISVQGRENLHGAYYPPTQSIYIFGGYSYEEHRYYDLIERIGTNPVSCTTLTETTWRADDDAMSFYDDVTGKIYCGPFIHSSQPVDNDGPTKRTIMEFDPVNEVMAVPEPALV